MLHVFIHFSLVLFNVTRLWPPTFCKTIKLFSKYFVMVVKFFPGPLLETYVGAHAIVLLEIHEIIMACKDSIYLFPCQSRRGEGVN